MHCTTETFTIGMLNQQKNAFDPDPPYQRDANVWSVDKSQLFIDSIFHGYDVPKFYVHDLRAADPLVSYAIIDGKQRLGAIWKFLAGEFALGETVDLDAAELRRNGLSDTNTPKKDQLLRELDQTWQTYFLGRALDFCLVTTNPAKSREEQVEEIDELFYRLNNGEPLNNAEKRNAITGHMQSLVRDISNSHKFLGAEHYVGFDRRRGNYDEIVARVARIEEAVRVGSDMYCQLTKAPLDKLYRENIRMEPGPRQDLEKRVRAGLDRMCRVFTKSDPLLQGAASVPLYYLFIKHMEKEYAHPTLHGKLRAFLEDFERVRAENRKLQEEDRDGVLLEYDLLMRQGTLAAESLRRRSSILRQRFVLFAPDVVVCDKKRTFSEEERFVIWVRDGKQCAACDKPLPQLEDMDADHVDRWADGGQTVLENARALCVTCNRSNRAPKPRVAADATSAGIYQ